MFTDNFEALYENFIVTKKHANYAQLPTVIKDGLNKLESAMVYLHDVFAMTKDPKMAKQPLPKKNARTLAIALGDAIKGFSTVLDGYYKIEPRPEALNSFERFLSEFNTALPDFTLAVDKLERYSKSAFSLSLSSLLNSPVEKKTKPVVVKPEIKKPDPVVVKPVEIKTKPESKQKIKQETKKPNPVVVKPVEIKTKPEVKKSNPVVVKPVEIKKPEIKPEIKKPKPIVRKPGTENDLVYVLDIYRDFAGNVNKNFDTHIKELTGSDKPIDAIKAKLDAFSQAVLSQKDTPQNQKIMTNIRSRMLSAYNFAYSTFTLSDNSLNNESILRDSWFEMKFGVMYNRDVLYASINTLDATDELKKELHQFIKDFEIKEKSVGSSKDSVDKFSNQINPLVAILDSISYLIPRPDRAKYSSAQSSRHELAVAFTDFEAFCAEYVKNADANPEEFYTKLGNMLTAFENYTDKANVIREEKGVDGSVTYKVNNFFGLTSSFLGTLKDALKNDSHKKLRSQIDVIRNKNVNKFNAALDDCYTKIAATDNAAEITSLVKVANSISDNAGIDGDKYYKAYFLAIAKCPEFRKAEKEALAKTKSNYASGNPDVDRMFLGVRGGVSHTTLSKEDFYANNVIRAEAYLKFIDDHEEIIKPPFDFENVRAAINSQVNSNLNDLPGDKSKAEFIANADDSADLNQVLYDNAKASSFLLKIGQYDIDALIQTSGNFNSDNSESYTKIYDSLSALQEVEPIVPGANAKLYEDVYSSLINYLRVHDSVPSSTNGKLRVNAAARACVKFGMELMNLYPAKQAEIMRDFKVQMIRNRAFRDEIEQESEKSLKEAMRGATEVVAGNIRDAWKPGVKRNFELHSFAVCLDSELKDMNSSAIVKGKCATKEAEDALLAKYINISASEQDIQNLFTRDYTNKKVNLLTGKVSPDEDDAINMHRRKIISIKNSSTIPFVDQDDLIKREFAEILYRQQRIENFETINLTRHDGSLKFAQLKDDREHAQAINELCNSELFQDFFVDHIRDIDGITYNKTAKPEAKFLAAFKAYQQNINHPSKANQKAYDKACADLTNAIKPVNEFTNYFKKVPYMYRHSFENVIVTLPYNMKFEETRKMFLEYYNSQKLMNYKDFRKVLAKHKNLRDIPEISSEQIRENERLQSKALDMLLKKAYDWNVVGIPDEDINALTGYDRTVKSVALLSGRENNDENLKRIHTLANGTIEEKKALYDKILKEYLDCDINIFKKSYTDEELIEAWPKIYRTAGQLSMELGNFDGLMEHMGVHHDEELWAKVQNLMAIATPFYNYYGLRINMLTCEYGKYIPADYKLPIEAVADLTSKFKNNYPVARLMTSMNPDCHEISLTSYAFEAMPALLGKKLIGVYLEDGTKISGDNMKQFANSLDTLEYMKPGKKILMRFEGESYPYVTSFEDLNMPPQTKEYSSLPYKDIWNKELFDARKAAATKATAEYMATDTKFDANNINELNEKLAKRKYLRIVKNKIPDAGKKELASMFGDNMAKNVAGIKGIIENIVNKMPANELSSLISNGELEKTVDTKFAEVTKVKEVPQADDNLEKGKPEVDDSILKKSLDDNLINTSTSINK